MSGVEYQLIPGTAIPLDDDQSASGEGRGTPLFVPGRIPGPSLFEKIAGVDGLTPSELQVAQAALRAYDRRPKVERIVDDSVTGQTDATTGNVVIPLFTVPAGWEAQVAHVMVDAPLAGATISPSVPFANAATWAFVAIAPSATTGFPAANADQLRGAAVTFAPNPASGSGPVLPFEWTFNDSNGPVAFGNEMVYYVLHGGSQATVKGIDLQVTFRFNLCSRDAVAA